MRAIPSHVALLPALALTAGLAACASGYAPALDGGGGGRCGDGILQSTLGEQCDDGNPYGGDGCSANCRVEAGVEVDCDNGLDDDADGLVDCADPGCRADPACQGVQETLCDNGIDDDDDGVVDCDDPDCAGQPACGTTTETVCDNGLDDDADGLTDCADADCAADPACQGGGETVCDNGLDDDADGLTDCADTDCGGRACGPNGRLCQSTACVCPGGLLSEVACDDNQDDDCDGQVDCDDSDCTSTSACVTSETSCTNGIDDDGDTLVDCADITDCNGQSCGSYGLVCQAGSCTCPGGSAEICGDNQDNNCNGQVDENCAPTTCSDPLNPSLDCGSGYHCTPQTTLGDPGQCVPPVGLGIQYSNCTTDADCAAPYTCANTGTGVWCLQYCTSYLQCPGALDDCYPFSSPLYVYTQEWGACWDGY